MKRRRLRLWVWCVILLLSMIGAIGLSNWIVAVWPNADYSPTETTNNTQISIATENQQQIINLGKFKLTAYCPCEKCCGQYAINRPKDKAGHEIVYTADGSIAEEDWTIAADTSVLPFGSVVQINGHFYQVQDRGGAIKHNHIDIYFTSHDAALDFGVQYADVYIVYPQTTL